MRSIKERVIKYYDDLKNEIDIKTEEKLISDNISNEEKEKLNRLRNQMINKIDEILHLNLKFLTSKEFDLETRREEYFQPKFCFLNDSTNFTLGQLVITNQYALRDWNYQFSLLISGHKDLKDQIIDALKNSNKDMEIVDLSIPENNILKKVYLNFTKSKIDENFHILNSLINIDHIEKLEINISDNLPKEFFAKFKSLKSLVIYLSFNLESECFLGCNIENLEINSHGRDINISINSLNNLTKLKKLKISNIKIQNFRSKCLANLNQLNTIIFRECKIDNLRSFCLQGLASLKHLYFKECSIQKIGKYGFNCKSLRYLNLKESTLPHCFEPVWFNPLVNLEYLNLGLLNQNKRESVTNSIGLKLDFEELKLPKLKFLAIDSYVLPVFDNLNLQFLQVNYLQSFESISSMNQANLKGLCLQVPMSLFVKIKRDYLENLENLVHLEFRLIKSEYILDDSENVTEEFFKSLLKPLNEKKVLCKEFNNACLATIYEDLEEMIKNEIDFSESTESFVIDSLSDYTLNREF
ncbi:unnamed protein product [Brachionus calyciflorus]|uniref:Uncharacterized protein n=1 Tax=Brachionus calyciflorus TaxID=104777 RepID=A0A813RAE2_9BILA|nr:unnamed protein product [Brachionus calyciflorus]